MSIKPVIEPITLLAGMSSVGTIVTDTTFFTYSGDSNDWNDTHSLVASHSAIWEAGNGNWGAIYNRPTTLSGYGITDAAPYSTYTLLTAKSAKWDSSNPVYTSVTADFYKATQETIKSINQTSYTLLTSDNGRVIRTDTVDATEIIIPSGLGAGFNCLILQTNVGQVTISGSDDVSFNGVLGGDSITINGEQGGAFIFAYDTDTFNINGSVSGGSVNSLTDSINALVSSNSAEWYGGNQAYTWVQSNSANALFDSILATNAEFDSLTASAITSGSYKSSSEIIYNVNDDNHTLTQSDNGKIIAMDSPYPKMVIVPLGLGVGFSCTIIQLGVGVVQIISQDGVTLNGVNETNVDITGQHGGSIVFAYAPNSFNVTGSIVGDNLGDPVDWSRVNNTPTTIAGYGILDAATQTSVNDINDRSVNWDSAYSSIASYGSNWQSNYSTTNANSAKWNSTYSTVTSNSAAWGSSNTSTSIVSSNSANWQSAYTTVNTNSGSWKSAYTTTNANSANWASNFTTVNNNSANWASNYTTTNTNSANWKSVYSTVNSNSGSWGGAIDLTVLSSNSANWTSTYSTVSSNSANWVNRANTTLSALSVTGTLSANTIIADKHIGNAGTIATQTGTSYTLALSDNGKVVTFSNNSAITLTIPTGLGIGYSTTFVQLGTGQITVNPSGTTVNSFLSYRKTAGQYAGATLFAYLSNTFVLAGALSA